MSYFVYESSCVDEDIKIGKESKGWYFCHPPKRARIGEKCSLEQNVNISNNVKIGDGVKIQNNVSVYKGVEIEDDVFCAPSYVIFNDLIPRAKYPKGHENYKNTLIKRGASIGANATIVCGHTVGEWALIGADAVVASDVPAHALMFATPAIRKGWVCKCGSVLNEDLKCSCGRKCEYIFWGVLNKKKIDYSLYKEVA